VPPSKCATTLMVMAAMIGFFALQTRCAEAQKVPTATEPLHIAVFGGGTGVKTGFGASKNADITAGLDIGFVPYRGLHPSLEVRGSIAVDKGKTDSQKDVLVGLRLGGNRNRFHPYGDVLFGRAQINYPGIGAQVPGTPIFYTSSTTYALAGGGGVDYDLTRHFALKVDSQLERLATPVTPGHIYPYNVTIGVVYTIGGGWRRNRNR
jgi:hypothetical protein